MTARCIRPYRRPWSENRALAGQAAAAGGAERRRLLGGPAGLAGFGDGQFHGFGVGAEGFDGDLVAEPFDGAGAAGDVRAAFVVVGAEVFVDGVINNPRVPWGYLLLRADAVRARADHRRHRAGAGRQPGRDPVPAGVAAPCGQVHQRRRRPGRERRQTPRTGSRNGHATSWPRPCAERRWPRRCARPGSSPGRTPPACDARTRAHRERAPAGAGGRRSRWPRIATSPARPSGLPPGAGGRRSRWPRIATSPRRSTGRSRSRLAAAVRGDRGSQADWCGCGGGCHSGVVRAARRTWRPRRAARPGDDTAGWDPARRHGRDPARGGINLMSKNGRL